MIVPRSFSSVIFAGIVLLLSNPNLTWPAPLDPPPDVLRGLATGEPLPSKVEDYVLPHLRYPLSLSGFCAAFQNILPGLKTVCQVSDSGPFFLIFLDEHLQEVGNASLSFTTVARLSHQPASGLYLSHIVLKDQRFRGQGFYRLFLQRCTALLQLVGKYTNHQISLIATTGYSKNMGPTHGAYTWAQAGFEFLRRPQAIETSDLFMDDQDELAFRFGRHWWQHAEARRIQLRFLDWYNRRWTRQPQDLPPPSRVAETALSWLRPWDFSEFAVETPRGVLPLGKEFMGESRIDNPLTWSGVFYPSDPSSPSFQKASTTWWQDPASCQEALMDLQRRHAHGQLYPFTVKDMPPLSKDPS